jgi:hypothetical protein
MKWIVYSEMAYCLLLLVSTLVVLCVVASLP